MLVFTNNGLTYCVLFVCKRNASISAELRNLRAIDDFHPRRFVDLPHWNLKFCRGEIYIYHIEGRLLSWPQHQTLFSKRMVGFRPNRSQILHSNVCDPWSEHQVILWSIVQGGLCWNIESSSCQVPWPVDFLRHHRQPQFAVALTPNPLTANIEESQTSGQDCVVLTLAALSLARWVVVVVSRLFWSALEDRLFRTS